MPWREQFGLPFWAAKDGLDLLHSPCLTAPLRLRCASIVTIHDMIWQSPPKSSVKGFGSLKRKLMNWYYYFVPKVAAGNASLIITVSQASKDRISQRLAIPEEKIVVTYEAADPNFRQIRESEQVCAIRKKYNLSAKYIMAIGSADPRKNIATLIRAYAQLPANVKVDYRLVIIWTHTLMAKNLAKQVSDLGLNEYVCFIAQVSNDDLVLLYNGASLFVFPSLDEGFGLPLLEAMACGTPVISVDNSSIPEIVGDAALLADAEDVTTITNLMAEVLMNEALQRNLREKGLKRAAEFSWGKCASETQAVYQKVVKHRNIRNKGATQNGETV
jgi:glycosyltransferase involved in cell wall biosynthesis